ncbi:MAG: DUF3570 domain-containing protein [Sphingobacteriaceae bacterium]
MKKIYLTAAGIISILQVYAQSSPTDTGYLSRKLKLDEINLVSSYYNQNGNNSAVTGGIGTEKLNDVANSIDIKLIKYDKKLRKHSFTLDMGIDHYTSASSDMIDLKANSSASHADTRIYPSINWSMENENKGTTIAAGISSSTEYDYQSYGANVLFAKKTKNHMGELTAKMQVYIDQVSLIAPIELRSNGMSDGNDNYNITPRNTFAGSLSYSQIINERLQVIFMADFVQQQGYLSLPFHRVYFTDGGVHQENLPINRLKLPLGFRANYFLGDRFILRTYYRYYTDNWGLHSNTAELELPVKMSPFFSISPFYRFYQQSAIAYFSAFKTHTAADQYYTSNFDFSKFNSQFVGLGIHFTPPNGILRVKRLNMIELRYGHYFKTTGMNANIISLNLKFK